MKYTEEMIRNITIPNEEIITDIEDEQGSIRRLEIEIKERQKFVSFLQAILSFRGKCDSTGDK